MGKLIAICVSEKKGTAKSRVDSATLQKDYGVKGDAHGGNWHRQISMLGLEKIEDFKKRGAEVDFGAFGENLIIEGFDLRAMPVGTRFRIGEATVEMTQIGKECHSHCAIYHMVGDCIMPREGVFAKVIQGGTIHPGDEVECIGIPEDRPYTCARVTMSDKVNGRQIYCVVTDAYGNTMQTEIVILEIC